MCASDAPARVIIQNFVQYNGKYGCAFCLYEGEQVQKGKGFARVYPVPKTDIEVRTLENALEHSENGT